MNFFYVLAVALFSIVSTVSSSKDHNSSIKSTKWECKHYKDVFTLEFISDTTVRVGFVHTSDSTKKSDVGTYTYNHPTVKILSGEGKVESGIVSGDTMTFRPKMVFIKK